MDLDPGHPDSITPSSGVDSASASAEPQWAVPFGTLAPSPVESVPQPSTADDADRPQRRATSSRAATGSRAGASSDADRRAIREVMNYRGSSADPDDGLISRAVSCSEELAGWAADLSVRGLGSQPDDFVLSTIVRVEEASRFLDGVKLQLAAIVEERTNWGGINDGMAFPYGHTRSAPLIEELTRISGSDASRRVRLGSQLRAQTSIHGDVIPPRYEEVAAAVMAGEMAPPVAERIVQGLEQARKFHLPSDNEPPGEFEENIAAAEEALVEQATRESADLVGVQVTAWRDALDPDGAPLRDEDVRDRRGLQCGRERNGVTPWTWKTTGETTAMLKEILAEAAAASTPRFLPGEWANPLDPDGLVLTTPEQTAAILAPTTDTDDTAAAGDSGGIDCEEFGIVLDVTDTRTREQRDNDVLDGYLRAGIRASADEMGGIKPIVEVTAVATLADLEAGRGVGWLSGVDEPVSIDTIKELACGRGYRVMIQGDHGEVLWMGKKPRLFSEAQKKAVVLRDGPGCSIAGCHKPSRQCHVHHVEFFSQGGPTDVDNAILLCNEHHHMIHKSPFEIRMHHGVPQILAPRWLNPKQTWKPLGHPRHRMPKLKHSRT
jgi:hypothetical protein